MIRINPAYDSQQGGNPEALRDGATVEPQSHRRGVLLGHFAGLSGPRS
jgi:hypothetical protein